MSLRSRVRKLEEELYRRCDEVLAIADDQAALTQAVEGKVVQLREDAEEVVTVIGTLIGGDHAALVLHDEALGVLDARLQALEETELSPDEAEAALNEAILAGQVVTFKYRDREGKSSYRVVSPYELQEHGYEIESDLPLVDAYVSVLGYDHGREGIRHFRIKRIEGAVTCTRVEPYRQPQREETV